MRLVVYDFQLHRTGVAQKKFRRDLKKFVTGDIEPRALRKESPRRERRAW
jgi:hypothetical protein